MKEGSFKKVVKSCLGRCLKKKTLVTFLTMFIFSPHPLQAFEITEKVSFEGNITWVHQWLEKLKGDFKDKDRGAGVIDATLKIKPTETDEFTLRAAFAKEKGIKKLNPFEISVNNIDLRDDLHNINGRSRDHIKELWYGKSFKLPSNSTLKITIGIIDAASFIDENRYANDEYTQFLNEVFVNNPLANLVSYDYGVALEYEIGNINLKAVGMQSKTEHTSEDEEVLKRFHKKTYNYYSLQGGYKWDSRFGEGNIRIYGFKTNKKFPDWKESKKKALKGWGVSFDQEVIKDLVGIFARLGYQDDSAQISYKNMYEIGLSSNFCVLNRKITWGLGYAFLKAPSKHEELKKSKVFETYLAIPIFELDKKVSSTLSFDWQYVRDYLKEEKDKAGQIYGVRFNLAF